MTSRDIIGRCIEKVEHRRWYNEHLKRTEIVVDRIILDDGSVLYPFAFETTSEPAATIHHVKPAIGRA